MNELQPNRPLRAALVLAHGDRGLEPTRVDDVVEIRAFPVGPGNIAIPASVRTLASMRGACYDAHRLNGIRTKGRKYPLVTWRDAQHERHSCCVRNETDAGDPLFASLAEKSRARLFAAVGVVQP
jgi:hypothetical protein